MNSHPILIIGGGLAGLTAARLLYRAGIDFQLLEARDRLGGRILSTAASGAEAEDGFDLGPSWFWPRVQPVMTALVKELGLACFPQHSEGDIIFQRMSREPPQRYRGLRREPQSMRIAGGTGTLIAALAADIPKGRIQLGLRVIRVARHDGDVEVTFCGANGIEKNLKAGHVVFALPPRLLEATVAFSPALAVATTRRWRDTPTWMAPHAKFFAIYDRPFWREAGLSGTAQSMVGPLLEIHDATTASGQAALFGFVGIPAGPRATMGREAIVAASLRQLVCLFGFEAAEPRTTLWKDWAADSLTATADDGVTGAHPIPDQQSWVDESWRDFISLAGSETSRNEPGYLAGAVEAASEVAKEIIARKKLR